MSKEFKNFLIDNIFQPISSWLYTNYNLNISSDQLMNIVDKKNINTKIKNKPKDNSINIEVDDKYYKDRPGLYLELNHKFIIQELPTGDIVAIGIVDGDKERLLTKDEKKLAKELGLNVVDDDINETVPNTD